MLKEVMIMLRTLCRFFVLLALGSLFVYAPEILRTVSAPYQLAAPERILLRVTLCCGSEASPLANKAITAYQKDHPTVHLRITGVDAQQLPHLFSPYPDVILCTQQTAAQLPADFIHAAGNSVWLCAASPDCTSPAAAEFAAYIIEALPSPSMPY